MELILTAPVSSAVGDPTEKVLSTLSVELAEAKPFELRDYQKDCIAQVLEMWRIGRRAPLLYAPTGSGKTALAAHLINSENQAGRRVLFLVHRQELVEQTVAALQVYGIDCGYIKANYEQTDGSHSVIIAGMQTIARRQDQFPKNIALVIVDECHTTAWYKTYHQLEQHYSGGLLATSQVRFLGLTGSPWRTKSMTQYMGQHFDSIVRAPSPSELIRMGYLSPPRHFGWGGLADWSKLEIGADGEFDQRQAELFTINPEFNQLIVDKYLEICPDRKAIGFAQSVKQSKLLTELFNAAGIACEHLDASTPPAIRKQMYERLATGVTRILLTVATLCEGFNEPTISAVILGRLTKLFELVDSNVWPRASTSTGQERLFITRFLRKLQAAWVCYKKTPH